MKAKFLKRLEALERAWPEKIPVVPMMLVTRLNAGLPDEWVVVDGLHMTPAEADTHIREHPGIPVCVLQIVRSESPDESLSRSAKANPRVSDEASEGHEQLRRAPSGG